MPAAEDQYILLGKEIALTSTKAIERGMGNYALRRIAVYDAERDRTMELLTKNLDWKVATIAVLDKRRWKIEPFFKAMK